MNRTRLDDVELRIRLVPGVLSVGIERTEDEELAPVLTIVVDPAADLPTVDQEVRLLVEPVGEVEVQMMPITSSLSAAAVIERVLTDEAGAVACTVHTDPETGVEGIEGIEVTVETLADVARATDLVRAVLGEDFARTRLVVELEIPLG